MLVIGCERVCDVVFVVIPSNKLNLNEAKSNVIDFDRTSSDKNTNQKRIESDLMVSRWFSSKSIENTLIHSVFYKSLRAFYGWTTCLIIVLVECVWVLFFCATTLRLPHCYYMFCCCDVVVMCQCIWIVVSIICGNLDCFEIGAYRYIYIQIDW